MGKICAGIGCTAIVPKGVTRCDNCGGKPWHDKPRNIERPNVAEHNRTRRDTHRRAGGQCQIGYPDICTGKAERTDRIDNTRGYEPGNLQAACRKCHDRKTSYEGHLAQGHDVDHLAPPARPAPPPAPARPSDSGTPGSTDPLDILDGWRQGY
jgi:rubredoxin